jgi:hypothetical protein
MAASFGGTLDAGTSVDVTTDEAIRTYKTALEVYPGHLPTVEALARICVVKHPDSEELAGWLDQIAMQGETECWREWAGRVRTRMR